MKFVRVSLKNHWAHPEIYIFMQSHAGIIMNYAPLVYMQTLAQQRETDGMLCYAKANIKI